MEKGIFISHDDEMDGPARGQLGRDKCMENENRDETTVHHS